jgi:hypothetical protein
MLDRSGVVKLKPREKRTNSSKKVHSTNKTTKRFSLTNRFDGRFFDNQAREIDACPRHDKLRNDVRNRFQIHTPSTRMPRLVQAHHYKN